MADKLIIPGFWLKLKAAWWRLWRKQPEPGIAWYGKMATGFVNEKWGG